MRTMFGLSGRQLFILLVLCLLLFAGAQYVPGYFAALQFNDYVRQEVKFAVAARKTPEMVRDEAFAKANELGIPLKKNDVRITRQGPAFTMEIDYRWPINLRVYRHDLVFHLVELGESFENASN
jgi:hypothetical protein